MQDLFKRYETKLLQSKFFKSHVKSVHPWFFNKFLALLLDDKFTGDIVTNLNSMPAWAKPTFDLSKLETKILTPLILDKLGFLKAFDAIPADVLQDKMKKQVLVDLFIFLYYTPIYCIVQFSKNSVLVNNKANYRLTRSLLNVWKTTILEYDRTLKGGQGITSIADLIFSKDYKNFVVSLTKLVVFIRRQER